MGGLQCATLTVPMNYAQPGGRTVEIAVARAAATGPKSEKIGALVFNPGGPGAAGLPLLPGMAKVISPDIRRRFDIVTFDPRGVGQSRPQLKCSQQAQSGSTPELTATDATTYYTQTIKSQTGPLRACVKANSPFIDSVGTVTVAHDLDRLRQALGLAQINYWGISYGTRLGAVYAQLYPHQLRTLILDGNVTPSHDLTTFLTGAITGRDQAFAFFQRQYPAAGAAFVALAQRLQGGPVKLKDGKELTLGDVVDLVTGQLSSETAYPEMAAQLEAAAKAAGVSAGAGTPGTSPTLPASANPQNVQTADEGLNDTVLRAVNCTDLSGRPTAQQMATIAQQAEPSAPMFGSLDLSILPLCSGFPVRQDPIPAIHPVGAPGALVVNSEFDPATPLVWAQQVAAAIPGSRLVVYQGSQHGVTWRMGSPCVNAAADHYLLTGQLPAGNLTCPVVKPPA